MQSGWNGWMYVPDTQALVAFPSLIHRPTALFRTVNSTWHILSSTTGGEVAPCSTDGRIWFKLVATTAGESSSSNNSSVMWLSPRWTPYINTKSVSNFTKLLSLWIEFDISCLLETKQRENSKSSDFTRKNSFQSLNCDVFWTNKLLNVEVIYIYSESLWRICENLDFDLKFCAVRERRFSSPILWIILNEARQALDKMWN